MSRADDEDIRHRHFIAVATGSYDAAEFGSLPVRDEVDEFERWLCGPDLGARAFKRGEMQYEPTLEMVKKALSPNPPWTPAHAVAVYVTGHGFENGGHWIALKDTNQERPVATEALSTDHMIRMLAESDLDHLLVIVDVCYAGDGLGAVLNANITWKDTWLLLASSGRRQVAGAGALAGALRDFLAEARTTRKFNHGPYFAVAEFIGAIQERLPADQHLAPLQPNFLGSGSNFCLPNPTWEPEPATGPSIRPADLVAHWSPRARGVARDTDPGWFFTGRPDVMRQVLDVARGDPGTMILTGRAGTGKSATLSRLVTLADGEFVERYAAEVAAVPADLRPEVGCVDAAVLATGKLAVQVLDEICVAVGATRPDRATGVPTVHDLREAWWSWLRTQDRPSTVVLDALDEAENPRAVLDEVLSQLNPPGETPRVRLLVGVRSPAGDTVGPAETLADMAHAALGAETIRLDDTPFGDIAAFTRDVLTATPDSPYQSTDPRVVDRVVEQIAGRPGATYLFARTAATALVTRKEAIDPDDPQWRAALHDDLLGVVRDDIECTVGGAANRVRAVQLLRAVAFGHGCGIPWYQVWAKVATAIAGDTTFGDRDIEELLASPLAGYLAIDRDDDITGYRIADDTIRQALRERWWILDGQAPPPERESIADVEARIAAALSPRRPRPRTRAGTPVPAYVRRHLVEHAAAGGVLDQETVPSWLLPQLEPTRLRQADPTATGLPLSPAVRRVAHRWDWYRPQFNAAALRMSSALYGAPLDAAAFDDDWTVSWAISSPDTSEVLGRHPGVTVVAVSEPTNGQVIAVTGGLDGSRVWDLARGIRLGDPVADMPQPTSALAIVTQPGGRLVVVAANETDNGVWAADLVSPQLRGRLAVPDAGRITALGAAVLTDGRTVVLTGDHRGQFTSWDLATGARIGDAADRHSGPVNAIATVTTRVHKSVLAVSAGDDGKIRVWDPATANALSEPISAHTGPVHAMAATVLDGRPVAMIGGHDGTIHVWDLIDGVERGEPLTGHLGSVWAVSSTTLPDGHIYAVTCSDDPVMRVWDLTAHALHDDSMIGHERPVAALAAIRLPESGPIVVSGGRDGTVRSWPLTSLSGAAVGTNAPERDRISSVAVGTRPNSGRFAAVGSDADEVTLWNLADGSDAGVTLTGHVKAVSAVRTAVRTDGTTIVVTAAWDATLRVWNPIDGEQLGRALRGHAGPVLAMDTTTTADGRLVAVSGGMDGAVYFWDIARSSGIASYPSAGAWVTAAATASLPDGRAVAVTGTRDGKLRAWDVEERKPLGEPVGGHRGGVRALATAAVGDDVVVISGGDDGVVRMWNLLRMVPLGRRMTGHRGQIAAIATGVSPAGRAVALTGGDDAAVRVWDLATCMPTGVELPTPAPVRALAVEGGQHGLRIVIAGNGFLAVAERREADGGHSTIFP